MDMFDFLSDAGKKLFTPHLEAARLLQVCTASRGTTRFALLLA